jgi:hypothetical protein
MLVDAGCALDIVNINNNSALDHVNKEGFEGVKAAIKARGGRTGAEIKAAAGAGAGASVAKGLPAALLAAGERAKAARAALGPAAARAKGEQLLHACGSNSLEQALRLISEGADPNCIDKDKWTALHFACGADKTGAAVGPLIAAGAALDAVKDDGKSALIYAASNGREDAVKLLVAAGAAINLETKNRETALIWACYHGKGAAAQVLVDNGAALDVIDNGGNLACDYAERHGLAAVVAAIRARGGHTSAELKKNRR